VPGGFPKFIELHEKEEELLDGRYSLYWLYQHKRTNTDAAGAARMWGRVIKYFDKGLNRALIEP
jgi:hypothetical protein